MKKLDNRTEEVFIKLLDEHPSELILGALDEMARVNKEELLAVRQECEIIKKQGEIHQP